MCIYWFLSIKTNHEFVIYCINIRQKENDKKKTNVVQTHSHKRKKGKYSYWSLTRKPKNRYLYDNNRANAEKTKQKKIAHTYRDKNNSRFFVDAKRFIWGELVFQIDQSLVSWFIIWSHSWDHIIAILMCQISVNCFQFQFTRK